MKRNATHLIGWDNASKRYPFRVSTISGTCLGYFRHMRDAAAFVAALLLTATANAQSVPYQYGQQNGANVYQPPVRYSTYQDPYGNATTRGSDGSRYQSYTDPYGNTTLRGQDANGNAVRCTSYTDAYGNTTTRCN